MYKISLQNPVTPRSREVLKATKPPEGCGYVKGMREPTESSQWPNLEQFEQETNKAVVGYKPKYKINNDEPIVI